MKEFWKWAKKSYIYGYNYTSWISKVCNSFEVFYGSWNCHKTHL